MKNIYHIHTDFKFLYDSQRFESKFFNNTLIIIGEKNERNIDYHNSALFFSETENNIPVILSILKEADLIVIYNLCEFKLKLLKYIPKKTKIAWRFFGHELYSTRRDLMLTPKTTDIVEGRKTYNSALFYKLILWMKNKKRRKLAENKFKVTSKIDFILLYCQEEYDFLIQYWSVPQFVKLNLDVSFSGVRLIKKVEQVIIGNSKNIYNNHFDIIDQISTEAARSYKFVFFLNYGAAGAYSTELIERVGDKEHFDLITEFLSREQFNEIYRKSSALVINSHRQMALGNIFTAIKYGVKIYLNDLNPIKKWLTSNNILIFSTNDFANDLGKGNVKLNEMQMRHNISACEKLAKQYTQNDFCVRIKNLLT